MEYTRQTAAAGQDAIRQCSDAVQAYYSDSTDITLYASGGMIHWTEQGADYDSVDQLNSALESYVTDTYQDYYREQGYYKNGVLVLDADTLEEIEETAFLTVGANGMSGANLGYYLYWVKYPDGTEQEINIRL